MYRKDHGKTDNPTFRALASIALSTMPLQLARAGAYLSEVLENPNRVGELGIESQMTNIESYVASCLTE
jgi:hypothetical protein